MEWGGGAPWQDQTGSALASGLCRKQTCERNRTDCAAGHMQRQQQTTPVYGFSLAEILQLPGRKGRRM